MRGKKAVQHSISLQKIADDFDQEAKESSENCYLMNSDTSLPDVFNVPDGNPVSGNTAPIVGGQDPVGGQEPVGGQDPVGGQEPVGGQDPKLQTPRILQAKFPNFAGARVLQAFSLKCRIPEENLLPICGHTSAMLGWKPSLCIHRAGKCRHIGFREEDRQKFCYRSPPGAMDSFT